MSGHRYNRNIIPPEKVKLSRNLPEIVCNSIDSPRRKIIDRSFSNIRYSANNHTTRTGYNSTVSSAQSQKFQDFFYRSDWPSLSDTETCESPDCLELEGSDSSASSMFSWADTEGTRNVSKEWEKIQRTLYDEEGPKVTQQHLIDECEQWKTIFPHLRIVGRGFHLTDPNYDKGYDTEEEVLALNYDSDKNDSTLNDQENTLYENFEANYTIPPISDRKPHEVNVKSRLTSSKSRKKSSAFTLFEDLNTILHISPVSFSSYATNTEDRNKTSNLMKSEISSSKWRHRNVDSPDFVSLPFQSSTESDVIRDNSASSLYYRNHMNRLSGNELNYFKKQINQNVEQPKCNGEKSQFLEPIEFGLKKSVFNTFLQEPHNVRSGTARNRNISLPPINSDESKAKRKIFFDPVKPISGKTYRHNKKILTPLDVSSSTVPKHDIKIDVDALSLFENRSAAPKTKKNKKK